MMQEDDQAKYIVAMDPALAAQETPALPKMVPNAELVRPPACFEMGTVGWLLHLSGKVAISDYRWLQAMPRTAPAACLLRDNIMLSNEDQLIGSAIQPRGFVLCSARSCSSGQATALLADLI